MRRPSLWRFKKFPPVCAAARSRTRRIRLTTGRHHRSATPGRCGAGCSLQAPEAVAQPFAPARAPGAGERQHMLGCCERLVIVTLKSQDEPAAMGIRRRLDYGHSQRCRPAAVAMSIDLT